MCWAATLFCVSLATDSSKIAEETGKAWAAWCWDGYPLLEAFPLLPHLTLLLFISFYRFSPLSPCRTLCGINSLAELRSVPQGFCSSVDYLGRQNPRELCVGMVTRRMRTALRWSVGLFVWFVSSCNSGWVTVISSNPESFSAAGFLMTYFIVSCSSARDQTICK